jgi:hypothetical protein
MNALHQTHYYSSLLIQIISILSYLLFLCAPPRIYALQERIASRLCLYDINSRGKRICIRTHREQVCLAPTILVLVISLSNISLNNTSLYIS